jgi:glutamate 5-kinase
MGTKLTAAKLATASGTEVHIVDGREREIVLRVLRGEDVGTRFLARTDTLEGRKRWILSGLSHAGRLVVDTGAARALLQRNASLLPAGVLSVEGTFERGDSVDVLDGEGQVVARGIVNYPSDDVQRLRGLRSGEIERVLGYSYGSHIVHRNDLVCFTSQESPTDAPYTHSA